MGSSQSPPLALALVGALAAIPLAGACGQRHSGGAQLDEAADGASPTLRPRKAAVPKRSPTGAWAAEQAARSDPCAGI